MLTQPGLPNAEAEFKAVEQAAEAIGLRLVVAKVNNDRDIDGAFDIFKQHGVGALFVGAGPMLNSRRERVAALAALHKLPARCSNESENVGYWHLADVERRLPNVRFRG